jgi:hypothetical protein
VIYATTRVNSFTIFLLSLFYCRQNLCQAAQVPILCSSNTTYKPTSFDKDEILANHRSFMTSLSIPSGKDSEDLPYIYWIHKLHKTPCKERYIAGSSTCSTKELSIHRGYLRERSWFKVIQKIFRVFQNSHVIYATTRVNSFTIFLLSLFYCRQNLCQVIILLRMPNQGIRHK